MKIIVKSILNYIKRTRQINDATLSSNYRAKGNLLAYLAIIVIYSNSATLFHNAGYERQES